MEGKQAPPSGGYAQFIEAHGVRISPAKLTFDQFELKEVYAIDMNILNISPHRKAVRYYTPVGKEFKLKGKTLEDTISSGISLSISVEFKPADYTAKRDRVVITVDGEKVEVPVECNPCRPVLEVSPIIDFGVLCSNNKMVTSNLIITNTGSKAGSFEITYDTNLPININPLFGKVPANSRQKVKVELIAKQEIPNIDSKIMVKLEGISQPLAVQLSGSIVEGRLELYSTDEEQRLQSVRMGAAYFGTDRAVCAVLYNNSPEPTDFVVILQEGAPGQEAGNDVAGSAEGVLMKARRRYDGTAVDIMNIVSSIPNQGRLQPFQKIPFVIRFSPKWKYAPMGFQCSSEVPPRQDYALYLVVARVGTDLTNSPDVNTTTYAHDASRLEVPICASALAPQLDLSPGPEINFGDCAVSQHLQIPLQVRNMCQELPAAVVFPKIAHFRCYPDRIRLAPGQQMAVDIRFEPHHFGSFSQQQAVEILGEVFDKSDPFVIVCDVIHRQFLKLVGTSKAITTAPKPKFAPGITPLITNDVGINADVKWADSANAGVLRNAVVSSGSLRRSKKSKAQNVRKSSGTLSDTDMMEENKLAASSMADNAKIAFPNDKQRSIRPFDRRERFISIFTRISRYNYIDPDYAMTNVEMGEVVAHRRFYRRYIDDIKSLRRQCIRDKRAARFEGEPNIGLEPACGISPKKLGLTDIETEFARQKSEAAANNVTWSPLSSKQLAQMAIEAADLRDRCRTALQSTASVRKSTPTTRPHTTAACKAGATSGKPPVETLVPAPLTGTQRSECSRRLTPRELHQVTIDPGSVEFGEVCVRSAVRRELSILNNLDQHVSFKLKIDCAELRQSSPIQAVVPPRSRAVIPLCFEADQLGRFQRSLEYFINELHPGHITVTADVVPVELQLSTSHLVIMPTPGLSPEAGIRGVITLVNKRNRCAEFQWHPVLMDGVIAFSIRPAAGKVEPFQDLDCEVVFHASFFAPAEAQFLCNVKDGPRLNFSCAARLGQASCELIEKRILFGSVPIHLVTTKKAIIYNGGPHHAYFWVEEPNPLPGLTITPNYGVVPVGGTAELQVTVQPSGQMKFDTKTLISIRDHPTLDLRIGGSSEPSTVDIDISSFKYAGGVPLGTSATLPFVVTNKCLVRSQVVFDLTRYRDFGIRSKPDRIIPEENTFNSLNTGKFMLILAANESVECTLVFTPTEIASYDFVIPVSVNETMCRLPLPTPLPRTPIAASRRPSSVVVEHILTPKPIPVRLSTPCRRVTATAIRQTLKLSNTTIEFILPVGFEQKRRDFMIEERKMLTITNVGPQALKWRMDLASIPDTGIFKFFRAEGIPFLTLADSGSGFIEDQLNSQQSQQILIMFSPVIAGEWRYEVPVYLNEQERPCQSLHLYGCVRQPHLTFDPEALIMAPVPLQTRAEAKLHVLAYDYQIPTPVSVDVPAVDCESGGQVSPITVIFPEGNIVKPVSDNDDGFSEPTLMTVLVLFQCDRPISFSGKIVFHDADGRRFSLPVSASADNSLTTNYAFLASNQEGAKIVCEQGMRLKGTKSASTETVNMGEAVVVRISTGSSNGRPPADHRPQLSAASSGDQYGTVGGRMRPPSTAATTPSAFDVTMSSYEPTNDSSSTVSRDGAVNRNLPSIQSEGSHSKRPDTIMSRTFGSLLFPEEDSEQGMFHADVLSAVQRWFSLFAYPIKPYPIRVPHSLRLGCGRVEGIVWGGNQRAANGAHMSVNSAAASLKKDYQTVYQMMENLCGRPIPGMPADMPLPANLAERVKQLHWQHTTLLTFLRSQGAAVSGIRPEFLLEPAEFRAFLDIAHRQGHPLAPALGQWGNGRTREERDVEEELFEALSKQSWMNVLLQVVKTLVLSRITPRTLKMQPKPDRNLHMPSINPDPVASNLYSVSERVLLTWLNFYYEQYRRILWENSNRGGVPPSRWVVNFDLDLIDGLVLAAVVGAFVPFLIEEYLAQMYTYPATPEQCLHNALKLINSLRAIGLEFDIQAIEVTDPNPVALMLLVYELYQKLPYYLPKETVEFRGLMHSVATRQIRLVNHSDKPVIYQALLVGKNSADFQLPNGNMIAIGPRSQAIVGVSFTPRFLEHEEAVLVAVGRRQRSNTGTTMVFTLRGYVDNVKPVEVFKIDTPCYEMASLKLTVKNISATAGGKFTVRLIETHGNNSPDSALGNQLFKAIKRHQKLKKKKQDRVPKNVKARVDHGQPSRKVQTEELMRGVRRTSATNSASSDRSERSSEEAAAMSESSKPSLNQLLTAFYSPDTQVTLEPGGHALVTLFFLPFSIGSYYCSVVLSNDEIGDIVYAVNATSTLPLPDDLSLCDVSGQLNGRALSTMMSNAANVLDVRACQWLTSPGQELRGIIHVPLVNPAREKALVTAGQLRLSPVEYKRRSATNTLESATIAANSLITLLGDKVSSSELNELLSTTSAITFRIDRTDNEHFTMPEDITLPGHPLGSRGSSMASHLDLPVTFMATTPGVYNCDVLVASSTDYRLLRLSVSVTPPGQQADLTFRGSVGRVMSQMIPISNPTNFPWPLKALISGDGFTASDRLLVGAQQVANFPLTFHPTKPGESIGELVLKSDDPSLNVKFTFSLHGVGEDPPAKDGVVIDCQANQVVEHTVTVSNPTPRKLTFKVSCDIDCVVGPSLLSILPGHSRPYTFTCRPLSRGVIKGALVFEARSDVLLPTYDSDGDEIPDPYAHEAVEYDGFRVWFDMKIRVSPPLPVQHLDITACCLQSSILEIVIRNPTVENLKLTAVVEGDHHLLGAPMLEIEGHQSAMYELLYRPRRVGPSRGTVTFFSPICGEFWYDLSLMSITPPPLQLPSMKCQLGRWTSQMITLENPISEPISFVARLNNILNFRLDLDPTKPLVVKPKKTVDVSLTFTPSALGLGEGGQNCTVTFSCQQFGDLVYQVVGEGQLPEVQEPVLLIAEVGAAATVNIPWRNPFDIAVTLDISLIDLDEEKARLFGRIHTSKEAATALAASGIVPVPAEQRVATQTTSSMIVADGAFRVLSRPITGAFIPPRGAHSITVAFTPAMRRVHEATLVVKVRRANNQPWKIPPNSSSDSAVGETRDLSWLYPLNGLPDLGEPDWRRATVVKGTVGVPLSSKLEAALSGVATGRGQPATMSLWLEGDRSDSLALTEGSLSADEFSYNLLYPDTGSTAILGRLVTLKLVNQLQDRLTGLVVLRFQIDFTAENTFSHRAELLIHSSGGGMWKFPLTIAADYPPPVERISLPTLGGGLDSTATIVLSNTYVQDVVPFMARFEPQDASFFVEPDSGLLGPIGTAQAEAKLVIHFRPASYGRTRRSRLVAKIGTNKCVVYEVEGLGPQYDPPTGNVKVDSWNALYSGSAQSPSRRVRINYILQNMALTTTGVSSPIKGARLCKKKTKQTRQSSLPLINDTQT